MGASVNRTCLFLLLVACDKGDPPSTLPAPQRVEPPPPPIAIPVTLEMASDPSVEPPVQRAGTWKQVSMVGTTACAVRDDATIWCWGQVPLFGNGRVAEPRQIPGVSKATAVSVGLGSTCALVDDHAWCWGWNYDGSLGVAPTDTHDFRDKPVRVNISESLTAIAAGKGHTCALAASGAVWCWGYNEKGEVGVPTKKHDVNEPNDTRLPTRVTLPPARAITAGRGISCALERDRDAVWCWGDLEIRGSSGGDGTIVPPTKIDTLKNPTAIVASETSACALQRGAAPACWGSQVPIIGEVVKIRDRDASQLHTYADLAGATTIALAESRVCATTSKTRCFGWYPDLDVPILGAVIPGNFVQLASGPFEACGLTTKGDLWCWRFPPRKLPSP